MASNQHSIAHINLMTILIAILLFAVDRNHHASAEDVTAQTCTVSVLNIKMGSSAPVPTPLSFMGLSWEPLSSAALLFGRPEFVAFVKLLSSFDTGPFVLRLGGGSQEFSSWSKFLLGDEVWRALGSFHLETKALYMIGLNLIGGNSSLAVLQVENALRLIPPQAILSWGLGNEPEQYSRADRTISSTFFPGQWSKTAGRYCDALEPILSHHGLVISAPSIGFSPSDFIWNPQQSQSKPFLTSCQDLLGLITIHAYVVCRTNSRATLSTLLSETTMHRLGKAAASWVALSRMNFNRQPVRIEETNSFCEGGLAGISDTFAAALFIIDYSLTMLAQGIAGLNFHSSQCYPYSPVYAPNTCAGRIKGIHSSGCPETCGDPDAAPTINAPFYGLLFTQMVLSGLPSYYQGVSLLRPGCPLRYKQHVLRTLDGKLRIILIHKSFDAVEGSPPTPVTVAVHGQYSNAKVTVLSAPTLASKASEIDIDGQQIDRLGGWTGSVHRVDVISRRNSTTSTFEFDMALSAVCLEISPL